MIVAGGQGAWGEGWDIKDMGDKGNELPLFGNFTDQINSLSCIREC